MIDAEGAALLRRATPTGMGGTPDLFAPPCPEHDDGHAARCSEPWQCYEDAVAVYLERSATWPNVPRAETVPTAPLFRYPVPCPGYPKCLSDVGHTHWSTDQ